jgi:flagellar hook-length control protein FliK
VAKTHPLAVNELAATTAEGLVAGPAESTTSLPAAPGTAPQTTAPVGPSLVRLHDPLLVRRGRQTSESTALGPSDQNRFLQRVLRAFDAARNRDGEVRLRLSPPELGSMRLEVRVQEGAIIARLEAETDAARNLLIDHLPALRDRLAEQGIRVDQFDVDLLDRRDHPASDHGQQPTDQQTHVASDVHRQRGPSASQHDSREKPVVEHLPLGPNQQLNVIV